MCQNPKYKGKIIDILSNKGVNNAFVHLNSAACYGKSGVDIQDLVHGVESTGKHAIELLEGLYNDETKHLNHFIRMVTNLEVPLNMCVKKEYHQQSRFNSPLYENKVQEVLYKLT